jgi:TolB-like protein
MFCKLIYFRCKKNKIDANIIAIHTNTLVQMIKQDYQDMLDDHIHNKIISNITKNSNYKVITKKSYINYAT